MLPQIPQFMSNMALNESPFRFSQVLDAEVAGDANLMMNLWGESIYLYGVEVVYIERETKTAEPIFGEYLGSILKTGTRMYLQADNLSNNGGFAQQDLYSKFGLQVNDEETFQCPKLTFSQAKQNPLYDGTNNFFIPFFPKVGDLIYVPMAKKLFEINHIEDELMLGYMFGNRNAYQIKCKTYAYDNIKVDSTSTTIPDEVKALDNVMTINNILFDVQTQEDTNNNKPIRDNAIGIIINTEIDPMS